MHASLAELLENLKPGLLWVARDGTVRYANGEGTARTGLATSRKLYDPDLMRAVTAAIVGRVPRQVAAVGVKNTERSVSQELRCRVIPGLASDDAFVLIGHDVTHDDGVGYDNLMQVIRADVRDPLRDAQAEAGALATLYGSEHWLGRVFEECLEAAVRSARRGATLEIEHRQMGPRAMVIFRDCGVFVPRGVREGGTMLSSTAKSVPHGGLSARDQIGLKLCRHIVSLHGGQLRGEEEDGVRNFLIELPTGAPHRNDQSQLDVAQAQRYATDLAALMSRARTHGKPTGKTTLA
jgi:hypothetical protein